MLNIISHVVGMPCSVMSDSSVIPTPKYMPQILKASSETKL